MEEFGKIGKARFAILKGKIIISYIFCASEWCWSKNRVRNDEGFRVCRQSTIIMEPEPKTLTGSKGNSKKYIIHVWKLCFLVGLNPAVFSIKISLGLGNTT